MSAPRIPEHGRRPGFAGDSRETRDEVSVEELELLQARVETQLGNAAEIIENVADEDERAELAGRLHELQGEQEGADQEVVDISRRDAVKKIASIGAGLAAFLRFGSVDSAEAKSRKRTRRGRKKKETPAPRRLEQRERRITPDMRTEMEKKIRIRAVQEPKPKKGEKEGSQSLHDFDPEGMMSAAKSLLKTAAEEEADALEKHEKDKLLKEKNPDHKVDEKAKTWWADRLRPRKKGESDAEHLKGLEDAWAHVKNIRKALEWQSEVYGVKGQHIDMALAEQHVDTKEIGIQEKMLELVRMNYEAMSTLAYSIRLEESVGDLDAHMRKAFLQLPHAGKTLPKLGKRTFRKADFVQDQAILLARFFARERKYARIIDKTKLTKDVSRYLGGK